MRRVLEHIDRHPDAVLSLAKLSGLAGLSPHHFHRRFAAASGMTLQRYVRLARMKRAAHRLAFRTGASVTAITLDAGYTAPDAFARAFRRCLGQSPSAFRRSPDWRPWRAAFDPLDMARTRLMQDSAAQPAVRVIETAPIPVAMMCHHGDPAMLGATIRRFIGWRKANRLGPQISATYNIFHADPGTTPPEDFRLDLCAATTRPVAADGSGIMPGVIPGGRCAVLRVVGEGALAEGLRYLLADWLPASGERLRAFPPYCQRISVFPDVPESEAVIDLFLPLALEHFQGKCVRVAVENAPKIKG